eukprot:12351004-Alexandrium_andersonii.AAC.1
MDTTQMTQQHRELAQLLLSHGMLSREQEAGRFWNLRLTPVGTEHMLLSIDLRLGQSLLLPRERLPLRDCTVWELIVRLRLDGWECRAHRPRVEAYEVGGPKVW